MTYDPEAKDWFDHSEPPADPTPDPSVLAVEQLTARLRELTALYQDIANQLEPDDDPFS